MTSASIVPPSAVEERLPFSTRLLYGLGEAGEGLKTAALETFLFFFYVQVVGLSGALTGTALFIALLFDGLVDPSVGAWSDRTRSRLGHRHPFLYAAPIPLAIALIFLFSPPEAGQWLLFGWLLLFTIAARFAMTLYYVPHMALGAELTSDFSGRISLGAQRTFFGYAGRLAAIAIAFGFVFRATSPGVNGQLDRSAYPRLAVILGCLVVIVVIVSALGTQRRALQAAPQSHAPVSTLAALRLAMRSASFRALFFALLIMYCYNGVQGALALHMNTYYWQLTPAQIPWVLYASVAGFMIGIPLARPLSVRFDKKRPYMIGILGSCLIGSGPVILSLLGMTPSPGSAPLLALLVAAGLGLGLVGAIPVVLAAAMLGDVADEYEVLHGARVEGIVFGVNAFCRKASMGLGGVAAGLIVDLIHFPKGMSPGTIPEGPLFRLAVAYGPLMLAVLCIGLSAMRGYRLSRDEVEGITDRLRATGRR